MSGTISALAAQLKTLSSPPPCSTTTATTTTTGNKAEQQGNESMDSGVAGLRDGLTTSPHGGSPASTVTTVASSTTTSTVAIANSVLPLQYQQYHSTPYQQQQQYLYPAIPGAPDEVPHQYIIDRHSRTTYLKGKFLGKVRKQPSS